MSDLSSNQLFDDDQLIALADHYDSSGAAGAIHRYHLRRRDMLVLLRSVATESPPKDPTPEWVLKARAEGRAEFLAILLGEGAEDFCNDYVTSHPIADTGDYGSAWDLEKLRATFAVDDATYSYIDNVNGEWWSQQHEIETLRDQLQRASQPPTDGFRVGERVRLTSTTLEGIVKSVVRHYEVAGDGVRLLPSAVYAEYGLERVASTKSCPPCRLESGGERCGDCGYEKEAPRAAALDIPEFLRNQDNLRAERTATEKSATFEQAMQEFEDGTGSLSHEKGAHLTWCDACGRRKESGCVCPPVETQDCKDCGGSGVWHRQGVAVLNKPCPTCKPTGETPAPQCEICFNLPPVPLGGRYLCQTHEAEFRAWQAQMRTAASEEVSR